MGGLPLLQGRGLDRQTRPRRASGCASPTPKESCAREPPRAKWAAPKRELLDSLLEGCQSEQDLFGPEGVFTKLKGAVMERFLAAELTEHLGHEKQQRRQAGNTRNGYSSKTVQTESGPVNIRVPRDREGSFEPQLVKKHQRRLDGFDEKVIALYARRVTTRDIQQHLRELYGTDVSPELISRATDGVVEELKAWQNRPLDSVYAIIYLDTLFVSVRDSGQVTKRAFYVALGVRLDGTRDVSAIVASCTTDPDGMDEVQTSAATSADTTSPKGDCRASPRH